MRVALSLLGLGALLTATLHCVRSSSVPIETAFPAPAVDESYPDSSTASPPPAEEPAPLGTQPAPASAAPGGEPADDAAQTAASNPVARMMRATDEHDRTLLADIERETGRTPSEPVRQLVQRRRAGASREQLTQQVTALAGDVRERAAARRWLRAVFPADATPVSSPSPGTGGGERRLSPVTRTAP